MQNKPPIIQMFHRERGDCCNLHLSQTYKQLFAVYSKLTDEYYAEGFRFGALIMFDMVSGGA